MCWMVITSWELTFIVICSTPSSVTTLLTLRGSTVGLEMNLAKPSNLDASTSNCLVSLANSSRDVTPFRASRKSARAEDSRWLCDVRDEDASCSDSNLRLNACSIRAEACQGKGTVTNQQILNRRATYWSECSHVVIYFYSSKLNQIGSEVRVFSVRLNSYSDDMLKLGQFQTRKSPHLLFLIHLLLESQSAGPLQWSVLAFQKFVLLPTKVSSWGTDEQLLRPSYPWFWRMKRSGSRGRTEILVKQSKYIRMRRTGTSGSRPIFRLRRSRPNNEQFSTTFHHLILPEMLRGSQSGLRASSTRAIARLTPRRHASHSARPLKTQGRSSNATQVRITLGAAVALTAGVIWYTTTNIRIHNDASSEGITQKTSPTSRGAAKVDDTVLQTFVWGTNK